MPTNPTWKDPLLAEWWEGCSKETRALYAPAPSASATDLLLGFAETKQTVGLPDCAYHDARRLRTLIDAELARGREAVELLTKHQWGGMMGAICNECDHGSARGHAPDCRLAKVIASKP